MMKKDMDKGNMLEDTFVVEYARRPIKRKQRDTSLWLLLKYMLSLKTPYL